MARDASLAGAVLEPSIFSARLLRGLDARGRADLSLASRRHELSAGATLFVAGAAADALFVVLRGKLRIDGGVDPRRVEPGDVFGWDAAVPGAVRSGGARASEASELVELPLAALRRGLTRSGAEEILAREVRRVRLRTFRALLARTEIGAALAPRELDRLVAAAREEACAPGAELGVGAEPVAVAWLVVSGVVALARGAHGYAARGQLVGLEAALGERAKPHTLTALGDVLALALPSALLTGLRRQHPDAMERELSVARRRRERQVRALADPREGERATTFGRLESATSLLAIDVGACVDCGHCVTACADTHRFPRFSRRGERVSASVAQGAELAERAYLLPNACQHCKDAACLSECPTGALARDERGAVTLRTELCTGCAACVSACPWEAVKLVPRGSGAVAVKCDLCSGREGPECVLACPTAAITRVAPAEEFTELRVALGGKPREQPSARSVVGPWLARAAVLPPLAVALALLEHASGSVRFAAGIAGGVLLVLLAAHAVVKRVPSARELVGTWLRRALGARASLRPLVDLHATLGVLSLAFVLVHTGGRLGAGAAALLALSFWLVAGTGILGGALYVLLPRRLARLEPGSEPRPEAAELDRRFFAALSGGNDAVRAVARVFLIPHARGVSGALALLVSRRGPEDEARMLAARVNAALGGRTSARLENLESLVAAAVAIRAARAARLGRAVLAAFVPAHLVLALLLVVLLVVHVVGAVR
jgi:Fe-S-cluster-containing dehydrogenase component/CRP-like cAMP-binding protein